MRPLAGASITFHTRGDNNNARRFRAPNDKGEHMSETPAHARRWRVEVVLAVLAAALGVLTVVVPAWIEVLTGLDPDAGSGALEVLIAVGLFAVAGTAAWAARGHRRHEAEVGGDA